VQFVPAIQPTVAHMAVFQRTPAWILPRHDLDISRRTQRRFSAVPMLQRLERLKIYLQRDRWLSPSATQADETG
jgi:cation diffusion facilitator CzcD-associated flavoprotein CzcO